MMRPIDAIELRDVLPDVFAAAPEWDSDVWRRELKFVRGNTYLIEAESGTGKSSLCSFIYGNRCDYSGEIVMGGKEMKTLGTGELCRLRTRHISLLPQELRLFPELTVIENIEIKNRLTGFKSEPEIVSMLELLEIADKAEVPVARLSIGQQQRVAVIRALCQPFDFILLDEPVSHLDSRNNLLVSQLVAREAKAVNAGVIATSVGYTPALEFTDVLRL